jgi:hypothetical protein
MKSTPPPAPIRPRLGRHPGQGRTSTMSGSNTTRLRGRYPLRKRNVGAKRSAAVASPPDSDRRRQRAMSTCVKRTAHFGYCETGMITRNSRQDRTVYAPTTMRSGNIDRRTGRRPNVAAAVVHHVRRPARPAQVDHLAREAVIAGSGRITLTASVHTGSGGTTVQRAGNHGECRRHLRDLVKERLRRLGWVMQQEW